MIAAIIWLGAGFILRHTDALDWLHEMFHRATGTALGYTVTRYELSVTYFAAKTSADLPPAVFIAGYLGEAITYTILGILLALVPLWPVAGFCVGVLATLIFVVPGSTDMSWLGEAATYWIQFISVVGIFCIIQIMVRQWRKDGKADFLRNAKD